MPDDRNDRERAEGRRDGRRPDREAVRQGLDHAPRPEGRRSHRFRPSRPAPISIDYALGVGGVPRGRVIEIFGPESSGKTTLALQVIARGAEDWAAWRRSSTPSTRSTRSTRRSSASTSTTCSSRSPTTASRRSRSSKCSSAPNGVDVVVVDSVAALVPRAEIEGEMGEAQMGLQARLMSQALRKLTGVVSKSKTCLIFINQLREKIGVMFGNPETTTGGRALKFYASVRIDIRRIGAHQGRRRRWSAAARASRSSRTRSRRRSARPSSTSCTAKASRAKAICSISRSTQDRREERHLVRVRRRAPRPGPRERRSSSCKENPAIFKAIEEKVRQRARASCATPRSRPSDAHGYAECSTLNAQCRRSETRSRHLHSAFALRFQQPVRVHVADRDEDLVRPDEAKIATGGRFERRRIVLQPSNRFAKRRVLAPQPREIAKPFAVGAPRPNRSRSGRARRSVRSPAGHTPQRESSLGPSGCRTVRKLRKKVQAQSTARAAKVQVHSCR